MLKKGLVSHSVVPACQAVHVVGYQRPTEGHLPFWTPCGPPYWQASLESETYNFPSAVSLLQSYECMHD